MRVPFFHAIRNTQYVSPNLPSKHYIIIIDETFNLYYNCVMSNTRRGTHQQAVRKSGTGIGGQRLFSAAMLALLVIGALMGFKLFAGSTPVEEEIAPTAESTRIIQIAQPGMPAAPTVAAVEARALPVGVLYSGRVGLVAGHKGYDPGAACDDGLTEASINHSVALEAQDLLQRRGVQVDILEEFDPLLSGFQADALVSIHSDSCNIPGASGFKVARVTDSAIPEAEDLLVDCLSQEYGTYTGLPFHPGSITDGMTGYHAFREIDRQTPGAIIEIGFMLDDRWLLESRPKIVARGIAAGILCFLGETSSPTVQQISTDGQ